MDTYLKLKEDSNTKTGNPNDMPIGRAKSHSGSLSDE